MTYKNLILTTIALLLILTGSGGCFLQPVSKNTKTFNFIDMDAPAMRLAEPVKAKLLIKNEAGEWESAGKGFIPAGAYIKGRAPSKEVK